jgi:hypothetical protein
MYVWDGCSWSVSSTVVVDSCSLQILISTNSHYDAILPLLAVCHIIFMNPVLSSWLNVTFFNMWDKYGC